MSLSIAVFGLGSSTKPFSLTSHIKLIQVRRFMRLLFLSTSAFSTCVASEGLWSCILLGVAGLSSAAEAFRFHLGTKWVCAALPADRSVWSLLLLAPEKGGELTRPSRGKARLTLVAAMSLSLHLCWSVSLHALLVSAVQPAQRHSDGPPAFVCSSPSRVFILLLP